MFGSFFKTKISPSQKKPDANKNFFQNYRDHFHHLKLEGIYIYNRYQQTEQKCSLLLNEGLARLTLFDPLRDGYDYFDEVMGVTVVPFVSFTASLVFGAMAIWEGAHALAIKVGWEKRDKEDHFAQAMGFVLASVAAYVVSVTSYLKSLISLVTRPLVTVIQGSKPQDKDRFYDADVEARNTAIMGRVIA